MPLINLPPCPDSLKSIQHYLTIASEHDSRDVVVSYWCRLYALQQGMKIDKSSTEAKKLLYFLVDWLEAEKTKEKENEAIAHDIPAQAHLENYALKLFLWADQQDRAGVFNKNVVKAFYTAGMIYSVLETFGELTDEVVKNQKYAKWKAAYIHNCLKNAETPVPGPMGGEEEDYSEFNTGSNVPASGSSEGPSTSSNLPNQAPVAYQPPPRPVEPPSAHVVAYNIPAEPYPSASPSSDAKVSPEIIAQAQKMCKFASSALNYDDIPTAVCNLQKALTLLTAGKQE